MSIVLDGTTGITTPAETVSGTGVWSVGGTQIYKDASGNVGIGTGSPATKLHVNGGSQLIVDTTSPFLSIRETSSGNSNRATFVASTTGMEVVADYGTNPIPMLFKTANTERMRIDSSGNLGLGVTPSAWGGAYKALQLSTKTSLSQNASDMLLSANAYNNGPGWLYLTSSYATTYVQSSTGQHQWYTAPSGTAGTTITFTQAMTLDANGNLGIGTSNPSAPGAQTKIYAYASNSGNSLPTNAPLIIEQTGNTVLCISGSAANEAGIFMPRSTDAYYSGVYRSDTNLILRNNGSERARIDSSGNLLVGTTSAISGAKLTVNGQISTSVFIGINKTTATTIATGVSFLAVLRDRGSGGTALVLYENNTTPVIVSQVGSVFTTSAPTASQIQIANLSGGGGITALAGTSKDPDNVNVCIIQNQ